MDVGWHLGGVGGWEAQHNPALCTHSPESQLWFGLHQKNCGQLFEGGDSTLLLQSTGVLIQLWISPTSEGQGSFGARPEKGCEDNQRAGTALLWRQTERIVAVQPGGGSWEILWRNYSLWRWWGTWTGCSEKLWMPHPWLEVFMVTLGGALSNLVKCKVSLPRARVLELDDF